MRKVCDMIRRITPANVTVLLCGENGSDKELIARTLHYYSPRKDASFTSLDCAGQLAHLMELELFGLEKEKSSVDRSDFFKKVQGGTIFLDNIEALSLKTQTKLLDVLQNKKIGKVGGSGGNEIDVRIIVASSERLESLVKKGEFYENLYYRLSAIQIDIPSLRNRTEDLPFLIRISPYKDR